MKTKYALKALTRLGKNFRRGLRTAGLCPVAVEVSDAGGRIDEPRHPAVARAMLLRDRQRVRDIARIHHLGGGRVAGAQKRTLLEAAGQQYADAESGR